MAKDTNGIQMVKKPHGTAMKAPIQSGNVSKRETIEELIESARTGNHASSARTILSPYVQLIVPEKPHQMDVKTKGSNACELKSIWSGS